MPPNQLEEAEWLNKAMKSILEHVDDEPKQLQ